jgi:hypothetical protein
MGDSVDDDVGEMIIRESVQDLASGPVSANDTGGLQDTQMLTDQRLSDAECSHELVHAPRRFSQLEDDRDPDRRRQRTQELARGDESVVRNRLPDLGGVVRFGSASVHRAVVMTGVETQGGSFGGEPHVIANRSHFDMHRCACQPPHVRSPTMER